jgi:UDP-glucose 4-epimerase
MKIGVFGANGYIGRHIVRYIALNKKADICCFDTHENFNGDQAVSYSRIDITDSSQLTQCADDLDIIYFFSGLTGTDISFDKYELFIRVNELGLLNLLDRYKTCSKKPKIVFPGTRLVYRGKADQPLAEDAEKEFKTIYASSKYNGELYLEMYRNLYGFDFTVFRICVPYAHVIEGKFSYGTISFFLDKARRNEPIGLYGDGSLKRTFTHVLDICRQVVEVSGMPESNGQVYNVAGETFSLQQIARLVAAKYKVDVAFNEWPEKAWKLESGDTIFDGTKISRMIDPVLKYNFSDWLNENE